MDVVDDQRLLELARDPPRELLAPTRRGPALQPLVVLLAFLPGLLVFRYPVLDESASGWGLQAAQSRFAEVENVGNADQPFARSRTEQQMPMASWLTVLSLRWELISPESRLMLASYGGTVLLLFGVYQLVWRFGGTRWAFFTILLACCHREFLNLNRQLPPVALALACSVLGFAAAVGHIRGARRWLSLPLVVSGLSFGAALLAGGSVAVVAFGIVTVHRLFFVAEELASSGQSSRRPMRRRIIGVAEAVSNLCVIVAVVVGVGAAWHTLAEPTPFSGSSFLESWQSFWISLGSVPSVQSRWSWIAVLNSLTSASGFLLMFIVLGGTQAVWNLIRTNEPDRRFGDIFVLWCLAVALVMWLLTWHEHRGDFHEGVAWNGFVLVPLLILAGRGLDSIIRRRWRTELIVAATILVYLADGFPRLLARSHDWFSLERLSFAAIAFLLLLAGLTRLLQLGNSDRFRRGTLWVCALGLVLIDVAHGIHSLQRFDGDERELRGLRRQLATESTPTACWLISESPPPARLQYFVHTMWLDLPVHLADEWDTVFAAELSSGARSNNRGSAIVVTWGSQRWPVVDLRERGESLVQITAPHYFQQRLLKAYRWSSRADSVVRTSAP